MSNLIKLVNQASLSQLKAAGERTDRYSKADYVFNGWSMVTRALIRRRKPELSATHTAINELFCRELHFT